MNATRFVNASTRLAAVPYVPEVRLHLADEAVALWERTEEATGVRQPPPFWAFAWAGGQALARHVVDHPELVAGRRVLDLASGSGLVAIAAAFAGAAEVTANEIDPLAAAAIALNADANGLVVGAGRDGLDSGLRVVLGDLLADAPTPREPDVLGGTDVVLAGDVFYSRPMVARLLPFLLRALAGGAEVLVGDPGRAYLPPERFEVVAVHHVPVLASLEDTEVKRTTVLRLLG